MDVMQELQKSREKKEKESHRIVDIEGVDVARIQILKAWKEFMDKCSWTSDLRMFLNTTSIRGLTVSQLFKVVNSFIAQTEMKNWKRIEGECEFLPEIDRSAIVVVEEASALRLKRLILGVYLRENVEKQQSMYEFFNTVEVRGMPVSILLEVFQDLLIETKYFLYC